MNTVVTSRFKNVAIVHDWLVGGGAELVVEQLHKAFPDAPIYTSYCSDEWRRRLDGKVKTGWLQHFGSIRKYIPFLRIWWFSRLRLDDYDLVISSSGAEAKGIKTSRATIHVNYCHTPTHYYWSRYDEYREHPGFGPFDWLARIGLTCLVAPLRRWDYKAAQRPDYMVANSNHIQREIKKYYHRDSVVIFPPVYLKRFQDLKPTKQAYFLISGRQTPYKRFDLAVAACSQLGVRLHVIGAGPDNARLKKLASSNVTFLGRLSDADLAIEFANSQALLFPGIDDFGITPVEALAAGTPVIAYKAGGALDYVRPGISGEFFSEQTTASLAAAIQAFKPDNYTTQTLRAVAAEFSTEVFHDKLSQLLDSVK